MSPRPRKPARVIGPKWMPSRNEWRVLTVGEDGRRRSRGFVDQSAARNYAATMERRLGELKDTRVYQALPNYRTFLVTTRRNKIRSADDTIWRIEKFFPDQTARLRALTEDRARKLYDELKSRPRIIKLGEKKTKEGPPISVDSRLDILSTVKTFFRWCVATQIMGANPLENFTEDAAIRNHGGMGRSVLRRKELRRLLDHSMERAAAGDERALGILLALVLGMRSNEVVRCQIRDVDDHDWIIEIPLESAKTDRSRRLFAVPVAIQPLVTAAMKGKEPEHYLLGGAVRHDRGWLTDTLEGMCRTLKFPRIETAHGLRGAHNDLARQAGATGEEIIRQLGHESESTTSRSYTSDEGRRAISEGKAKRVLSVLSGGKGR